MASAVVLSIGGQTGGAENAKDVGQAAQLRSVALLYAASNAGDYTGLCDAKINNSPVFKTLGDVNDTKRDCKDTKSNWVVVWKEKKGDNFSCIGELKNRTFSADSGGGVRFRTGQARIGCTRITQPTNPHKLDRDDLEDSYQDIFFAP